MKTPQCRGDISPHTVPRQVYSTEKVKGAWMQLDIASRVSFFYISRASYISKFYFCFYFLTFREHNPFLQTRIVGIPDRQPSPDNRKLVDPIEHMDSIKIKTMDRNYKTVPSLEHIEEFKTEYPFVDSTF